MFDPKIITQAVQDALAASATSQSLLQSSFTAGVGAMQVDGPGNATAVMGSVTSALRNMTQQLDVVAQTLHADAATHQAAQQAQQPSDFTVATPDLRRTTAQGFPGEQGEAFFNEVKG